GGRRGAGRIPARRLTAAFFGANSQRRDESTHSKSGGRPLQMRIMLPLAAPVGLWAAGVSSAPAPLPGLTHPALPPPPPHPPRPAGPATLPRGRRWRPHRPDAGLPAGRGRLRPAAAQAAAVRLADLRPVQQLLARRLPRGLPVQRLAVHRPVLPLPQGPAGLA